MNARHRHASDRAQSILEALRSSLTLLRGALVVLLLVYLCSGITSVAPHETALVLRFGKLQPAMQRAGLVLALPAPFEEVIKIPVQSVQEVTLDGWAAPDGPAPARVTEFEASQRTDGTDVLKRPYLHPVEHGYSLTGDANIVQGRFAARYRIVDPVAWFRLGERRGELIEALLYNALTTTLAGRPVDHVLTAGLEETRNATLARAQEQSDALQLGIQITAFEVREVTPAQHVRPAFAEVVNAEMEARAAVENARSYQVSQLPLAEAEAYRLRHSAEADAKGRLADARGKSSAFLAVLTEYQRQPALVRTRLRAETMQVVMGKIASKSFLPSSAEGARVILTPRSSKQ